MMLNDRLRRSRPARPTLLRQAFLLKELAHMSFSIPMDG